MSEDKRDPFANLKACIKFRADNSMSFGDNCSVLDIYDRVFGGSRMLEGAVLIESEKQNFGNFPPDPGIVWTEDARGNLVAKTKAGAFTFLKDGTFSYKPA